MPYWYDVIVPELRAGRRAIIVAHGNSLRALIKYLDKISDEEIPALNIPTGVNLVYELDERLNPLTHYYLGDPAEIKKATEAVAQAGKNRIEVDGRFGHDFLTFNLSGARPVTKSSMAPGLRSPHSR